MAITQDLVGWNSWPTGPLRSGPMVGEVGETDAFIWAQARDASQLVLTVSGANQFSETVKATPTAADGLCLLFHVTGLSPGNLYTYYIASQNGNTPSYQLQAAPAASARKVRIAFGSCFLEYTDGAIFEKVAMEKPDFFLMCGDNCYYPENIQDENNMMLVQLKHRNCDKLRPLLANHATLGIWDDHDFGPNDSDSSYPDKDDSLDAFRHIWAQRSFGSPLGKGIYSAVRCGPVEVFLLDGRYFRVEKNHILGPDQLNWLKDRLTQSTAAIKLIVSGSVVLPGFVKIMENGRWEGWRRDAPGELDSLLSYIETNDIHGVVFASGDLHLGYLLRQPGRPVGGGRRGPDYWEVIASPLGNPPWDKTVTLGPGDVLYDPSLIDEFAVQNFGILDVDLDRSGAEVHLLLQSAGGAILIDSAVALDSLKQRPLPLIPMVWNNGKAYFFKGTRYARYTMDPASEGVDPGYPKTTQGNWKGLAEAFPDGIDAGVAWGNGQAYFFRGNGYVRYTMDPATEGVDPGYPKYISGNWKGLWPDGIDAAVVWPKGKAYFFKGTQYIRYTMDPSAEGTDPGYPKPIKGNWKGLAEAFPDGIDGAAVWPNGKAYFFKGDRYVRYTIDPANEGVDPGYPRLIQGNWKGLEKL